MIRFVLFLSLLLSMPVSASGQSPETAPIGGTIRVPIDHDRPRADTAELHYELGAPFDRRKPTVLLVADGQQYFLRPGATAALQRQLFGDAVNVVGLISRGATPDFLAFSRGADGRTDWVRAWRLFNSRQWLGDLDLLRRSLVGRDGHVSLYGRSGGAYLVHQYLASDSQHIDRAFTQSPANPAIARELGIGPDHFWEDLGREEPALQPMLLRALARFPDERIAILLALQRQHFFVSAERLAEARRDLIRSLAEGDPSRFRQLRRDYEVDGVLELMNSEAAVPQVVRVVELLMPSGAFASPSAGRVSPLIEPQRHFAAPLLALIESGTISAPAYSTAAAHRSTAEVFVLAGRRDEAVDYRVAAALAYSYPRHVLFIADDNHTFIGLTGRHLDAPLISSFLAFSAASPRFRAALAAAEPARWRE